MDTGKDRVLHFVRGLPDDLSSEEVEREVIKDLRYHRYIKTLVARGREAKRKGQVTSHAEVKKQLGIDE